MRLRTHLLGKQHHLNKMLSLTYFSLTSTRKGGFGSTTHRSIQLNKKDDPQIPGITDVKNVNKFLTDVFNAKIVIHEVRNKFHVSLP